MAGFELSDWDDVGDVIERALELPAGDRDAALRDACAGDAERLTHARGLLAAAERAQSFLDRGAVDLAPALLAGVCDSDQRDAPARLGAYRILRLVGRGGMGDVYLAERDDDEFKRQVAVKVVRAGLGAELVARFRSERQLLASLDHPHIAQLHDGGVAPDGRPYLVMEYVDGKPLDVFCDERTLTIDRRLELFLQVCDAVDRAHRRLVVHRDLKPANILITAEGAAKLLDFGVAKLLDPETAEAESPLTRAGARVLTPEYASPEQFLGEPTTTAADVYSLGIILFELLAGRRPYEEEDADGFSLERRVLSGDITPPSVACRAATKRSSGPDRARVRGVSLDALRRRLRGDLDNIVLTALRREPDRRYASVAALRDDIERHRTQRPVLARPVSATYRAGKFVRRHSVDVAAAAAAAAAVVAGTTATLLQARTAAREGQRATQIRDFLVGVFESSDPDRSRGQNVSARDLLDRGSQRIANELSGDADLRAEMLGVLGSLYLQLGVFDRARSHLEESLALRRANGAPSATLVASLSSLAAVDHEQGRPDDAEVLLREALVIARSGTGLRSAEAGVLSDLAAVHRFRGKFDLSEADARSALAIRRSLDDETGLVDTLNGLGMTLKDAGRPAEAMAALDESRALAQRLYGALHTKTNLVQCNLAVARHRAGQIAAALDGFRSCIETRRRLLGDDHPSVAIALNEMALVHSERNEYAPAERLYVDALRIHRKAYGERHRLVAAALNNLAILAFQRGQYMEAANRFRELTGIWRELLGPEHPDALATLNNLGMSLRSAGKVAEAREVLESVLEGRTKALGPEHPDVAASMVNLATVLRRQGEFARMRVLTMRAIPIYERAFPDGNPLIATAFQVLGQAQFGEGAFRDALASFERAIAMRTKIFGATHLQTAAARISRGEALGAMGRTAEARTVIQSALDDLVAGNHQESQTAKDGAAALVALNQRRN
jgi:serine/threonine protein kinase/tetratricopeptide (TPR) repeat protein